MRNRTYHAITCFSIAEKGYVGQLEVHTKLPPNKRAFTAGRFLVHLLRFCFACLTLGCLAVLITYRTVPDHHGNASHFDALIVLGSPPDPNGSPSPEQRERVLEAVREWKAGRAETIIVSGGETLPGLVEADTMALVAVEAGVPPAKIVSERRALNTIQNIFFCQQIMQQHRWNTAEVISSPSHLPRASLILEHWNFGWRVRAAHWPASYTFSRIAPYYLHEALGTTALRWFGFRQSPYLPPEPNARLGNADSILARGRPARQLSREWLRVSRAREPASSVGNTASS